MPQKMFRYFAPALLLVAVGCAGLGGNPLDPSDMAYEAPPVVFPTEIPAEERLINDGSLFSPSSRNWSYWTDDTAQTVGDIVTVRVFVDHTAQKSASTDLSRDSKLEAGVKALFGIESSLPGVGSTHRLDSTTPEQLISAQSSNSFSGEGDTMRSDRIVADVSAIVMQVHPNGNMQIHGMQNLLINNDNSILTVDGLIRPSDVSYDNIVLSDRIAQCRIQITGRGVISDKQRPGLLSRTFDWLWPL
ncbi:flagellar basal body L-ring protein FlgH [bacterium]|nr:flagellar basal body L-ring protein FlgH [bacterium]